MKSVSTAGGYVQQLAADQPSIATPLPRNEPESDPLEEFGIPNEELTLDNSRRTGDIKIYGYYIRVAGKWTVLLYLFTSACCVFGLTFPGELLTSFLQSSRIPLMKVQS
jgi:hypothetical protein